MAHISQFIRTYTHVIIEHGRKFFFPFSFSIFFRDFFLSFSFSRSGKIVSQEEGKINAENIFSYDKKGEAFALRRVPAQAE
jgi:hypothetical protein